MAQAACSEHAGRSKNLADGARLARLRQFPREFQLVRL
jgi:hypothetical protein